MATFVKIADFVEHVTEKVHNLGTDALVLALSNTLPSSETTAPTADGNGVLANVTQVAYTNLSTRALVQSGSAQVAGVYKLSITDRIITSTGGPTGPFRYVYIYNDSSVTPTDALIGYYDYGSSITLLDGESLTLNFDDAGGVLTLT